MPTATVPAGVAPAATHGALDARARDVLAAALERAPAHVTRASLAAPARSRETTRTEGAKARERHDVAVVMEAAEESLAAFSDDENARAAALDRAILEGEPAGSFEPAPLAFDFDASPQPPDYVVPGVIERGTVAMLAADTGAAKSILVQWLTACALEGKPWLERSTEAIERVVIVDEENPDGLVRARLRAMGLTNANANGLRFYSREGFTLGDETTDARLEAILREFKPDLFVVDTLMSSSAVEVNDNAAAVKMMKHLRRLAREHECAVLVLHHERKQSENGPVAGSSQQTMGARQWAGQADALLTLAVETDMDRDELDSGGYRLRRTFKLRLAEKDRDGRMNGHRRIAVESEKDERDRLLWLTVTDEGEISKTNAEENARESILRALDKAGGRMTRKDAACAAGQRKPEAPDGTFKRAWDALKGNGLVEQDGNAVKLTDAGRAAVDALGLAVGAV